METAIVKIGNSRGLIIPKKLLSTFGEANQVDIQEKQQEINETSASVK